MNIQLKTIVDGHYLEVMKRFDQNLFEALKPAQADMEIVEFTGSKKGDRVHIRFNSPVKAEWVSVITEDGNDEKEAWFVDEGVQLPFPLSYWRHRHVVQKISDQQSCIIDDMTFKGTNILLTALLYPAIYAGFYPRKKIYQSYFKAT